MASRSIDDLHPQLAYAYGQACGIWAMKYPKDPLPILTATHRSGTEQDLLYAQPRDGKDNDGDGRIDEADEFVTNAKAGQSAHNYLPALALDIAFIGQNKKPDWSTRLFEQFALLMKQSPNITWGGDFKKFVDRPHFELTDWESRAKTTPARVSNNSMPVSTPPPMPSKVSAIPPVKNKLPPPPKK